MTPVFVDTSAWWAFFVDDDQWHPEAHLAMTSLRATNRPLVITRDVFGELVTGLSGRGRHDLAARAGRELLQNPNVTLALIEPDTWREAWRLFQREGRPRVSLTDCISIAVMRERRIREIFTFDGDFRGRGFHVTPEA